MLKEVENAQTEAESFRSSLSGVLSISASVAFGRSQIVQHLPRFLADYPDIDVDLCLLDRQVDLVEEGLDVLVRLCDAPPDQLVAHRLSPVTYSVVALTALMATLPELTVPTELAKVPCLFYACRKHEASWRFHHGRKS